jgi:SM-20-related protein
LTAFEVTSLANAGFFFRDDFLSPHLANRIRGEALSLVSQGALRVAGVGREGKVDSRIRGDHLCWLEKASAGKGIRALMLAFEKLRQTVNRELYLGMSRYEMQLAHYPPGSSGYSKHLDAFRGGGNRLLTAIYYLNPTWKPGHGGELALYLPGGELRLEPLQNRLLVFLAEEVEHAVLPVEASRLALTAWFHRSGPAAN